ncbi:hypothetical protein [Desulfurobacterium crinifex]
MTSCIYAGDQRDAVFVELKRERLSPSGSTALFRCPAYRYQVNANVMQCLISTFFTCPTCYMQVEKGSL